MYFDICDLKSFFCVAVSTTHYFLKVKNNVKPIGSVKKGLMFR